MSRDRGRRASIDALDDRLHAPVARGNVACLRRAGSRRAGFGSAIARGGRRADWDKSGHWIVSVFAAPQEVR